MKSLTPLALIAVAVGLFFTYVDPTYERIGELKVEEDRYDQALDRSKELTAVREQLIARYNTFSKEDHERLRKLLPDSVDNVRLIIDINNIAGRYGMSLKSVAVQEGGGTAENASEGMAVTRSLSLSFTVTSSYDNFIQFLQDLERSLRIVEVTGLTFQTGDIDFNEYQVTIETYWLG